MSTMPDTHRRILKTTEKAELERQINFAEQDAKGEIPEFDRRLNQVASIVKAPADTAAVYRAARARKALRDGEVGELSPQERDALYKRQKELETFIKSQMLTRNEYYAQQTNGRGGINPDFSKSVNSILQRELSSSYTNAVLEWQNICRMLEPENPNAGNVEQIRPN